MRPFIGLSAGAQKVFNGQDLLFLRAESGVHLLPPLSAFVFGQVDNNALSAGAGLRYSF